MFNYKFRQRIQVLIGPILIVLLWQLIYSINLFDKSLFASPLETAKTFIRLFTTGNISIDIIDSLFRMLCGFFFAAVLGVLLGLLIGHNTRIFKSIEGVVDFFRSIPVTTLYPVFVLLFGIDHLSKIAMVFWSCIFVITLNTSYGVIQSSKLKREMALLYGASTSQIFKWVTIYEALPQTIIGFRVAISFALIVEILCEMFMGSENGIGQRITEAFTMYSISELYALILVAGILGYLLNRLFSYFEKRLAPWIGV